MAKVKFIVKLNKLGKQEINKNGLDLLLWDGKGFMCAEVDCSSSFTSLKILHPENPNKIYEAWIPSHYIQFVLRVPTGENQRKVHGFDTNLFDSGLESRRKG